MKKKIFQRIPREKLIKLIKMNKIQPININLNLEPHKNRLFKRISKLNTFKNKLSFIKIKYRNLDKKKLLKFLLRITNSKVLSYYNLIKPIKQFKDLLIYLKPLNNINFWAILQIK